MNQTAVPQTPETELHRVRPRAVAIGLILALLICAVTPFNNVYRQGTLLGGGHFPLAPFFILFWITLLMAGASRLFKGRSLLGGRELMVIWLLMVLGSGIAYTGLVRTFFINLTAPYHFATVGNRFEEVLQPLLPKALMPQDPAAIEMLYNGLDHGRAMSWLEVAANIPWHAWAAPLASWGVFILLAYLVMISMVNILGRQWIANERMNFPLLQVPRLMEEAQEEGRLGAFLLDHYFLLGLSLPVFLHLVNGLHFYIPSVPEIPTMFDSGAFFPKHGLFSAFYKIKVLIYPAFIGFAFLTTRQISFSFWVFYILGGLFIGLLSIMGYDIPSAALGVTFGPHLTRPEETQMIGAYGVFFLFILWLARHHLWAVLCEAVGRRKPAPPETEWVSQRLSFWTFAAGSLALVIWCRHFGMPLMVSILVLGTFFMVMLVACRVICQGGIAYFTLTAAPLDGLTAMLGTGWFTHVGLVVAAVAQKVMFVDLRESLMPSLFHAGKIGQDVKNKRLVLGGILLTLGLAVAVSFLAMLTLCYKYGIRELQLEWATQTSLTVSENLKQIIESDSRPEHWVRVFSMIGAAVMLGLVVCYNRFPWWPVHPIGYLTAYSTAMNTLWFSFFVGWLANALTMRYGGVALFRKLRLLFVGLIVGDFLMGGGYALIGLFSQASYQVLPN